MQDKSKTELIKELSNLRKEFAKIQQEKQKCKIDKILSNIYKKVFLTTNDHFSIISPSYKYIEVNNSYLKAHGINREDIVNHKVEDIFGKDIFEKYIKKNIDSCKEGKEIDYSKWFEFPIGQKKFMQVNYRPCYINNQVKGVIVNSHDVTKLKEKEMLLEKTNLEKDKLFSIIAHDLRSPFSGILGFTNLLLQNPKDFKPEQITEIIKIIHSLTENTLELLENLLEWANLKRNKIPFNLKKLNLKKIIVSELQNLKAMAILKNIEIENNVNEKKEVFADENMLKTTIRNLINNALKFTNEGGKITISARENGNFTEIHIKDNGVGIAEKKIKRLFTFQKNNSTLGTNEEKGTGLGLMLCKEFVEKHGGKMMVISQEKKGSDFYFSLPNKNSI